MIWVSTDVLYETKCKRLDARGRGAESEAPGWGAASDVWRPRAGALGCGGGGEAVQAVGSECALAVRARGPRAQVATNVLVTLWLPRALQLTPRRDRAHARLPLRPPSGAPGIPAWGRPSMRAAAQTHAHTHRDPAGGPSSRTPPPPPGGAGVGPPRPPGAGGHRQAPAEGGGRRAGGGRAVAPLCAPAPPPRRPSPPRAPPLSPTDERILDLRGRDIFRALSRPDAFGIAPLSGATRPLGERRWRRLRSGLGAGVAARGPWVGALLGRTAGPPGAPAPVPRPPPEEAASSVPQPPANAAAPANATAAAPLAGRRRRSGGGGVRPFAGSRAGGGAGRRVGTVKRDR